jgi:threonine dehydrogenase-like Zn-dependent dehydrogenase/glycosyltransferase involved in cell wall biosynthesis
MPDPTPETSIIVRAFNEERHLPALFDAFDRQAYRDFEVILVDSGSLDRSRDIAAGRGAQVLRIDSHDFTFGYSLNVGIGAAIGRFIVIVSAHTVPRGDDWLANLIDPLRDGETAMAYGRQLGVAESKFGEAEDFRRVFGAVPRTLEPPHFFANNANAAMRRSLWESYPFDEELTGLEDIDWAKHWMEKGYQVVYAPDAALYHIHEESWRQVRRRYYREAVAARRIGIKGRRDMAREIVRESVWALADLGRAFWPGDNPVSARLGLFGRLGEILTFRANKTAGTVRGLLAAHPMETREEREDMLFDRTGTAVVVRGPGKAGLEAVPIPDLKPGDVLIQVAHVAVCATDLEILDGRLGYFQNGLADYPIVPGHEFSGRIAAVGQNVTSVAVGDPVVVECIQSCGTCARCRADNFIGCDDRTELGVFRRDGAYAQFVVSPARFVHAIPADLDLRKAALVEPLAVILKGLRRLGPALEATNGSRCGVVGAGPLGHLCAKVLAGRGFKVTAFDRSPQRLAFLDGSGIGGTTDLAGLADCPLVVEATGNPEALEATLGASPAGATHLLLGLPYGPRSFSFETVAAYDKAVVGSVGSAAEDFAAAIRLLPDLDLDAHLGSSKPLADFADAWAESRRGDVLKIILDVE